MTGIASGIPKSGTRPRARRGVGIRVPPALSVSGLPGSAAVAPRSIVLNPSAGTVSHGPFRRPATGPGRWRPARRPSPTWIQPSCPPTWPPPIVISRRIVGRRPGPRSRRRSHRGSARAGSRGAPSQWPIAVGVAASPAPDVPPQLDRIAVVDLDQVEQPVEVEVGQRSAAALGEARGSRPRRPPRRTSRPAGRGTGCSGPSWRSRAAASTLPLDTNRSMNPSLLTSWNSGCQAVDGSVSPPVNGSRGVDAALERRCRDRSACVGPAVSVWSRLSPWLVR